MMSADGDSGATPGTENPEAAMAGAGTGATPDGEAEKQLGDAGKELLAKFRQELKERDQMVKDLQEKLEKQGKSEAEAQAAKDAEDKRKKELAEMSDIERVMAELEAEREARKQLEGRITGTLVRQEFDRQAAAAGVHADAVNDLYELSKAAIQGDPENVSKALDAARQAKPYFFSKSAGGGTRGIDGGAGTSGSGKGPMLNKDEAMFAKALGIDPKDYDASKS